MVLDLKYVHESRAFDFILSHPDAGVVGSPAHEYALLLDRALRQRDMMIRSVSTSIGELITEVASLQNPELVSQFDRDDACFFCWSPEIGDAAEHAMNLIRSCSSLQNQVPKMIASLLNVRCSYDELAEYIGNMGSAKKKKQLFSTQLHDQIMNYFDQDGNNIRHARNQFEHKPIDLSQTFFSVKINRLAMPLLIEKSSVTVELIEYSKDALRSVRKFADTLLSSFFEPSLERTIFYPGIDLSSSRLSGSGILQHIMIARRPRESLVIHRADGQTYRLHVKEGVMSENSPYRAHSS